jgi:hypothetical protein
MLFFLLSFTFLGRKWYVLLEKAPGFGTRKQLESGAINMTFGKRLKVLYCLCSLTWGSWTPKTVALKLFCSQDPFVLKVIEDAQELLFMFVVSVSIFNFKIKTEKFQALKPSSTHPTSCQSDESSCFVWLLENSAITERE